MSVARRTIWLMMTMTAAAAAQTPAGVVHRPLDPIADSTAWLNVTTPPVQAPTLGQRRAFAPVVSAILPGGGQLMLGDNRFIVYFAVEAVAWWSYAKSVHEESLDEASFKGIARTVARAHFTTGSPNALPDAPWSYYEHMRDHLESGQYTLAVGGDVVPETDVTTYNGMLWQLALSTNPTHAAALQEYERTAIKPEFEWSWRNAQLQFDIFSRMTFKRDDAYAAGTRALLVAGLNHVFSLVDAFTTVRLRARADENGRTSIGASVPW